MRNNMILNLFLTSCRYPILTSFLSVSSSHEIPSNRSSNPYHWPRGLQYIGNDRRFRLVGFAFVQLHGNGNIVSTRFQRRDRFFHGNDRH